ncbi:MAG: protein SanA [Candidatus Magasanikbacteria bacterium RIFOXYC2_FULL_42_28]|uniref:Protein SanA n=1 Tax=Candidatus Magasanikbacteria bacterium RIFOXYC2_FULL_42_28 TaxID=1798704 RepID=A0A1F6NY43_9BACT|nr:MAG: protein SanA [Candidatus Magasanikbacteria bacterium RIFOXYC2_FULL_42_28]
MKKLKWILPILIFTTLAIIWLADFKIEHATNDLTYNDATEIPHNKVGLLLGTTKYAPSGQLNGYFVYRIQAAVDLFNNQKIDNIVISGDNGTKKYNEPEDMKNELVARGIPENKIYLDYAGFRTYDSVVRLNKIFGQDKFTIISQEFHNRRAIYIAQAKNLEAVGYNAKDINTYRGLRTKLREKLARVKVFIDLLTNKQPKFLGEEIEIK